jgi:PAS domain S-box-containing protein
VPTESLTVLLVEEGETDTAILDELRCGRFEPNVCRVDNVGDVRWALRKQPRDVILYDHDPSLQSHALDILRVVRYEMGLDTPVIFISDRIGEEAAVALMRAGAQDYILRSHLSRLPLTIRRELDAVRTRRAKQQADEKLDEQYRLLRQLMASVPDAIFFKDLELRYLGLNAAECRLLNAESPKAVTGRTADEFLSRERAGRWREEEQRVLATGEPMVDVIEQMRHEGEGDRWFSITKAPLRNRSGKIVGLVGISRDVTERQLNVQVRDEFISTVSHELRTPLTSIAGSLGLLVSDAAGPLPDQARHLLKIAHGSCERLMRLTNDILDIQHIEREALDDDSDPVDVAAILEKAIEANSGFAATFGTPLRLVKTGAPASVRANPDRLIQVVTNLLSNAVKFSPDGEPVTITLDADASEVKISVRDHGPGIPDSARDRIFERFFQVDASDSRQKGGTGLGLAIVKQIVEHLGGSVDFGDGPGGGTIFEVILPQAEALPAAEPAKASLAS